MRSIGDCFGMINLHNFPIFINYNSPENLVAQFNLSTDILKDVATEILTIITSQPNFLSLKFLVVCGGLSGSLV